MSKSERVFDENLRLLSLCKFYELGKMLFMMIEEKATDRHTGQSKACRSFPRSGRPGVM